mmetsp:Transcript_12166/g.35629  ORF Transcript_12166/g.35629 Transcript_12166/m.35629 type:complete len:225 (-) Transcript_12166:44-718(-)
MKTTFHIGIRRIDCHIDASENQQARSPDAQEERNRDECPHAKQNMEPILRNSMTKEELMREKCTGFCWDPERSDSSVLGIADHRCQHTHSPVPTGSDLSGDGAHSFVNCESGARYYSGGKAGPGRACALQGQAWGEIPRPPLRRSPYWHTRPFMPSARRNVDGELLSAILRIFILSLPAWGRLTRTTVVAPCGTAHRHTRCQPPLSRRRYVPLACLLPDDFFTS